MKTVDFWAGEFGDEYTDRNSGDDMMKSNIMLFKRIVKSPWLVRSVMELGCNKGLNLIALDFLDPTLSIAGVDCNKKSLQEAEAFFSGKDNARFYHGDIATFKINTTYDMVFTKGVLIHIPPDTLEKVYEIMYNLSKRYIMVAEYYNPVPVEIEYRGHDGKLWKRDFAGELLERFPLKLVDYGFWYHRDKFPQDDITWFLLEKED